MDETFSQQTKNKNRKKLLQQNTKLYNQLTHLQKQIDSFDEKQQKNIQQPNHTDLKTIIQQQQKQIRQLKQTVNLGRNSNFKQNIIYIKRQQDELLCLKRQFDNLQQEKSLLNIAHQDKIKKLANNDPLQHHKDQIQQLWANTKRQNRQMSLKIVQIQRQIRKLHNLKQRSKTKTSNSTNQQMQLSNLQSQMTKMNIQMKNKQQKWKPNNDVLDNQFFILKGNLNTMNKKLEQLQKQQKIWRLRAANLRDDNQIQIDRERLSKLLSKNNNNIVDVPSIIIDKKIQKKVEEMSGYYHSTKILKRNDKNVDLVKYQVSAIKTPRESISQKQRSPSRYVQNELHKIINKNNNNNTTTLQQTKNHQNNRNSEVKLRSNEHTLQKQKQKNKQKNIKSNIQITKNQKNNQKIILLQKQQLNNSAISPKNNPKIIINKNKKQNNKQKQLIFQQNKNHNNYLNRKQKQKNKYQNVNNQLNQILKIKVDEAKKINKNMQKYDDSVQKNIKKRSKDQRHYIQQNQTPALLLNKPHKINTEKIINLNNNKSKQRLISQKIIKQQKIKINGILDDQQNNKIIQKQSIKGINKNINKNDNNNDKSKQQLLKNHNKYYQNKQDRYKILTQNLNLVKIQSPKNKEQKKNQLHPEKIVPEQKSKNTNKNIKDDMRNHQIIAKNDNKNSKPIFQISIQDVVNKQSISKKSQAVANILKNNVVDQEDDMEGVPKIIKRKIFVGNQLVNAGTST